MKKLLIVLLAFVAVSLQGAVNEEGVTNVVTMSRYQQTSGDTLATISLCNTTADTLQSVSFTLTYFDKDSVMLHYEDFVLNVEIAPHMTREVQVKAYGTGHRFAYVDDAEEGDKPFLVTMHTHMCSKEKVAVCGTDENQVRYGLFNAPSTTGYILLALLIVFISVLAFCALLLPAFMARSQGRSPMLWFLIGWVITPIFAIILLALLNTSHPQEEQL